MELRTIEIERPEGANIILGQTHFIKSVEDLYEALVSAVPGIKCGLAFCEASGDCLIRSDGTDERLTRLAEQNALRIGAGHTFIVLLEGSYPINVLNRLKEVDEVCTIFCASANPVRVIVADEAGGRGVLGVIDGIVPKGIETTEARAHRLDFLRKIGYKR